MRQPSALPFPPRPQVSHPDGSYIRFPFSGAYNTDWRPLSGDHPRTQVTGVRNQHHIPFIHHGQRNVRQPLLRAQQGTDFPVRVQYNPIAFPVPAGNSIQQLIPVTDGIHIILRVGGSLAERLCDMGRGRYVWRSDTKVNDLLPCLSFCFLISASFEKILSPKRSILFANSISVILPYISESS